jgi:hypothetical protein
MLPRLDDGVGATMVLHAFAAACFPSGGRHHGIGNTFVRWRACLRSAN